MPAKVTHDRGSLLGHFPLMTRGSLLGSREMPGLRHSLQKCDHILFYNINYA